MKRSLVALRSSAPLALAVAFAAMASACDSNTTPTTKPVRSSSARALGFFSTKLPADTREQARRALEQDAFRRENRFIEAAAPGFLFGSTRVEQTELAAGLWSPEETFQLGAQLFNVTFTREMGFGGAGLPALGRFHSGRRGGPDAYKCTTCHWRGGMGGAGDGADNAYFDGDGDRQSSAIERNPPPLHGAGFVEILANEMTHELRFQRDRLLDTAKRRGGGITAPLMSKGVSFGTLIVDTNGAIDTSRVQGVDADLVVKPFGWKGTFVTIRDAVEEALNVHHGMQTEHLAAHGAVERVGAGGSEDPDGDGITREITEGQTSALTLFVAMQEVPQTILPLGLNVFISDTDFTTHWTNGRALFERIGCAECHRPSLRLDSSVFHLASRVGGKDIAIDLAKDGAEPKIAPRADGSGVYVDLYSDLRRHDMGSALREARADRGVPPEMFLTRPLWGLARSRPYLHDGRTPLTQEAILAHGGEAQVSRDNYAALPEPERASLRLFLSSLGRARRIVTQ